MNDILENLNKYLDPIKNFFDKYLAYIYFAIVAAMVGFIMIRVSSLINSDPSIQQETTVKIININSDQAEKIRGLQDLNIDASPNANAGRENPFQ
jgi:hypothetical protein